MSYEDYKRLLEQKKQANNEPTVKPTPIVTEVPVCDSKTGETQTQTGKVFGGDTTDIDKKTSTKGSTYDENGKTIGNTENNAVGSWGGPTE